MKIKEDKITKIVYNIMCFVFIFVFLSIIMSPNTLAIGISPAKTIINNENQQNLFDVSITVHNNNEENIFVDSYAEGNLILLNNESFEIPAKQSKTFLAQVQLIQNIPGTTGGIIFFTEKREGEGIQTLAEVGHKIEILNPTNYPFVYYNWSIHQQKNEVYMSFQNLGPLVSINPIIKIEDLEQQIGNIELYPYEQVIKLVPVEFDKFGEYIVSLIFNYEDTYIFDNKTIILGAPKIMIDRFQIGLFNIGEIARIETDYSIDWNKELQANAKLKVFETNSSENITVAIQSAKELANLEAFIEDTTVFFFDSVNVTKNRLLFELTIETPLYNQVEFFEYNINKAQNERKFIILLITLILIFFILTLLLLFRFQKKNKKVKSEIDRILKK